MKAVRYIGISVLFHLGLVALFLLKTSELPLAPKVYELQIANLAASAPAKANSKGHHSKRASQKSGAKLADLLPKFSLKASSDFESDTESELGGQHWLSERWQNSEAYLLDMNTEVKFSEQKGFLHEVYRRIDTHLIADNLLSEYNHVGDVYLRFTVNADGTLVSDSLAAKAADPILKVRSAWALRDALAKPMDRNFWLKTSKQHLVSAHFLWIPQDRCRSMQVGPLLTFCRNTVNGRVDASAGGSAAYYTKSLMAHGPFGIVEDFQNRKKQLNRRKTEFDPFLKEKQSPDYYL